MGQSSDHKWGSWNYSSRLIVSIRALIRGTHSRKKCRNCTGDYYDFSRTSCHGATRCSLRARNSLNRLLLQLTTRSSLAFQFLCPYLLAGREKEKPCCRNTFGETPSNDSRLTRSSATRRWSNCRITNILRMQNLHERWPRSIVVSRNDL